MSVDSSRSERLGALAGLVAALAVGAPFAVDAIRTGGELLVVPPLVWWTCYLTYLVVFVWDSQLPRPTWLDPRVLVLAQSLLGIAAYLLSGGFGWVPVLFVVTAATAAYELSRPTTIALVAVQTLLVAPGAVLEHGPGWSDAVLGTIVYGSFQVFAVMMVWAKQREAEARAREAEAHQHLEQAHAQLRATTVVLEASTRNAERLRIARDLHDAVGHQLTALALELEVATHRPQGAGDDHVHRARAIAKDLLSDVRRTVGQLRAPHHDLRDTLSRIATDLPHPDIHLDVGDDLEVDDETSLALVRCIQEIMTNTIRHADADNLRIELTAVDGEVVLDARDDGRGTDRLEPGHGLTGLRERIEALGGTVGFDSRPGQGLQVHARVPVP
jgi:signal transduction histidine kinase